MLNHITIMGRLTRDPELRRTGSGVAVTSFRVAVDRDFQPKDGGERKADFIDCVAWRQTGEFISKYFTKGRMIVVDGRLEMRDWTDKEGNKRTSAEIIVANAYFGDSKRDSEGGNSYGSGSYGGNSYGGNSYGNPAPAPSYGSYAAPGAAPASDFAMLEDDDAQLPF
ncbi:MAG TPA: single-stranded DNA-binding protein [Candidatus Faecousia faecipullorum]|nr:single-stranded DNA-binding protein [Candidatus Faecousia faecipullorum]